MGRKAWACQGCKAAAHNTYTSTRQLQVNPIPTILAEMEDEIDLAIQSNALPEEEADNGRRRINSGFYLVKSSESTIQAFTQIVDHARTSPLSEQPSFYTILCGDDMRYTVGLSDCINTDLHVNTRLLDRAIYPNGAMTEIVRGVTPSSQDDVAIVHFNWLEGHDAKVDSHIKAEMWMLDDHAQCMYEYGEMKKEQEKGEKEEKQQQPVLMPPQQQEEERHNHRHHQAALRRQHA